YLFFLSADHGAAHVSSFMSDNKLPGGVYSDSKLVKSLNASIEEKYKIKKAIVTSRNSQFYLDHEAIESSKANINEIKSLVIKALKNEDEVFDAVDLNDLENKTIPEQIKKAITYGYNAKRSGDIYYILKSNHFGGGRTGT